MTITTDPNALSPLTQLANKALQEQVRNVKEFATSSRWGASAIVLQLSEGPGGYEVRIGFELRTPLDDPIQTTITRLADSKEKAVRETVAEWLSLVFKPGMAIHSNADAGARLGETVNTALNRVFAWRMAEGPLQVVSDWPDEATDVRKELAARPLFTRLDMATILPMEREVPVFCLKMELVRSANAANPGAPAIQYECRLNNVDWPAGLDLLKRYHLPRGSHGLRATQYCFFRRTGKSAMKPAAPAASAPAAKAAAGKAKKPWWKFW